MISCFALSLRSQTSKASPYRHERPARDVIPRVSLRPMYCRSNRLPRYSAASHHLQPIHSPVHPSNSPPLTVPIAQPQLQAFGPINLTGGYRPCSELQHREMERLQRETQRKEEVQTAVSFQKDLLSRSLREPRQHLRTRGVNTTSSWANASLQQEIYRITACI